MPDYGLYGLPLVVVEQGQLAGRMGLFGFDDLDFLGEFLGHSVRFRSRLGRPPDQEESLAKPPSA